MSLLLSRVAHHISYAVPSIEEAVHRWSSLMHAGPFFYFERIAFDESTHRGKPCVFDHSAAFGYAGSAVIELQQIHASSPPSLTERLIPGELPAINHLAFISAQADEDSEALAAAGYPVFLHAKFGPVEIRLHDTRAALGQATEILRQCEFLETFFHEVIAAARGWDGKIPFRAWK